MASPRTLAEWALALLERPGIDVLLAPPPLPDPEREESWEPLEAGRSIPAGPARPDGLLVTDRSPRTPRRGALVRPEVRAQLVHTFLHHEVQAAELFAWAFLRFPETPREFRAGLLRLCQDELRHGRMYRAHLERLGHRHGDFPVRDWFWERLPGCTTPAGFTAFLGLGLEAGNLEHARRFTGWFREAGDEEGARIQEVVEREEVAHVAFALRWFERFTGRRDYDAFAAHLPEPLSPSVFRGLPLNRAARERAGMDGDFLDRLAAAPSTGQSGTRGGKASGGRVIPSEKPAG